MPQINIPQSVINWLARGERGISSETIVAALYGLPISGRWGWSHPHDPDDLQRCLKLLKASPETAARLEEMKTVSHEWRGLVERWSDLERMFLEEVGSLEECHWKSAPRTYAAMQVAIKGSAQTVSGDV